MGICHLLALPNLPRSTHATARNQVLKKAADWPKACDVMRWRGKKQRLEMSPHISDKHKCCHMCTHAWATGAAHLFVLTPNPDMMTATRVCICKPSDSPSINILCLKGQPHAARHDSSSVGRGSCREQLPGDQVRGWGYEHGGRSQSGRPFCQHEPWCPHGSLEKEAAQRPSAALWKSDPPPVELHQFPRSGSFLGSGHRTQD